MFTKFFVLKYIWICLKKPRLKNGAVPKLLLNGNAGNDDTPITLNTSNNFNVEPSIHSDSEIIFVFYYQIYIFYK